MTYPHIGLHIPVTGKSVGTTKHLQKIAHVQAGIHMKTSQALCILPGQAIRWCCSTTWAVADTGMLH